MSVCGALCLLLSAAGGSLSGYGNRINVSRLPKLTEVQRLSRNTPGLWTDWKS
ncbi:mCG147652 [Mus musculus]|nr:mCG147652 [Mus musculus]